MKRAIYPILALTLILSTAVYPLRAGEPLKTDQVEPKAVSVSSIGAFPTLEQLPFTLKPMAVVPVAQEKKQVAKAKPVVVKQVAQVKEKKVAISVSNKSEKQVEKKTEVAGRTAKFELTAYTNDVESTGKSKGDKGYGITASGKKTKEGVTASCPKSLPFGTKLYIPSLGKTYECQDRGSAITEGHLDIFIADYDDAMDFGRQKGVKVVILREN